MASKLKMRRRGGKARKHKGGVPAPADLQARRHGNAPVSLNQQPLRTSKVHRAKVADAKVAEKSQASAKPSVLSKDRQTFVAHRAELMKHVRAFGDHLGYLPSIPTSAASMSHNIRYTNALV